MSLLAESLVEEWLNRDGFFTIRGIKQGVREIDILAVKLSGDTPEYRHVEVQASFRPIAYISKLTGDMVPSFAKSKNSAKERPKSILSACVANWLQSKFTAPRTQQIRDHFMPKAKWTYHLIHGVVKYQDELDMIARCGVTLFPLRWVLQDVAWRTKGGVYCNPAGDLGEIMDYFYHSVTQEDNDRLG